MNTNPVLLACTVNKPESALTLVFIVVFLPDRGDSATVVALHFNPGLGRLILKGFPRL